MEIKSISDLCKAFRNGPYAWPGGYPLYFIMSDGGALSWKAAKAERRQMIEALHDYVTDGHEHSGWRPIAVEINYEDGSLFCDHSGERIESAYAEPE